MNINWSHSCTLVQKEMVRTTADCPELGRDIYGRGDLGVGASSDGEFNEMADDHPNLGHVTFSTEWRSRGSTVIY